jgi:hypothetical protein
MENGEIMSMVTIENGNMVQWINGTESKLTHEFADESKEFEKIIIFFQKEIFQGFIREDKKIIMWEIFGQNNLL